MAVEIAVMIESEIWVALPQAEAEAERAAHAALAAACPGLDAAELSLLLADDAALRELNRHWRGKDAPTNVLSFAATPARPGEVPRPALPGMPLILGDIAIAAETCAREAALQGKSRAQHLVHLVVHGVLHLLGYDHETEAEAEEMERLEIGILAGLGLPDPYAEPAEAADGR